MCVYFYIKYIYKCTNSRSAYYRKEVILQSLLASPCTAMYRYKTCIHACLYDLHVAERLRLAKLLVHIHTYVYGYRDSQ